MKPFTFWLAKRLVKTDYVSLPNLLAGRELVKELLRKSVDAKTGCAAPLPLLANRRNPATRCTIPSVDIQQIRCNTDEQAAQIWS